MKLASGALCTLTLLSLAPGKSAAVTPAPMTEVRVRLKRAQTVVRIGGFALRISPPTRFLTVAAPAGAAAGLHAKVRAVARGRWIVDWDNRPSEEFQGDRLWVKGQVVRLSGEAAPFDLELVSPAGGGIDVVAHLGVESYLLGVLPAEMPITWPIEALKAQAVAARSFALTMARERRARHFDVDSTIIDQVYKFSAASDRRPAWYAKLRRAVGETRGQVLTDQRGRTLRAFYSADCGCTTEDPRYVWGHLDGFESVSDPTCQSRRPLRWARTLNRAEVVRRLNRGLKLPRTTTLESLLIAGRTPSGRVASVVATLKDQAGGRRVDLTVAEFRRVFGPSRIRSADFELSWVGDRMKISGVGVGHGVGMCQTGARAMAENGSTYRAILKQYYPRAVVDGAEAI